ncbi:MAG TPA: FHA domain-containing protein, partial [Humisphaera sp.]
ERTRAFIANLLAYGVRGLIIGCLLAIAVPLTENNIPATIINGSVGAALGLAGGVAAAFVTQLIEASSRGAAEDSAAKFLTTVAIWGALGVFLTLAPGVVMRNPKKLAIGLTGGLIGGLIGGVLYEPIRNATEQPRLAELAAMVAIGLLAGLATGLIEDAAKTGWVKVVQGLIAGKQFILYRNPTFIGASPDCQIYLFKDPRVGKRHAAIHIVPGGFELEDLPLGSETLINGKPAKRSRLKNGDRIQIGGTQLVFMEKTQAA